MATWTSQNPLPETRVFGASATFGNYIYMVGGTAEVAAPFSTYRLTVLKARLNADGEVGTWSECAPPLTTGKVAPALFITDEGTLMLLGGDQPDINSDPSEAQQIWSGKLDVDGNLRGSWSINKGLPRNFTASGFAKSREFVYLVGGVHNTASLAYTGQTGNFTVTENITGETSGATGVVRADTDGGSTGTLTVEQIVGTFQASEVLAGDTTGRATSGTISALKLDYDGQLVNFPGSSPTVVGQNTGSRAVVASDADAGATGTLTLTSATADFDDNELLLVEHADVNGGLSAGIFLDYDTQTGDFTVGQVVTGGTSNATGTISADSDGGATGTLTLTGVTGTFQAGEALTDPITGAAVAVARQYKTLNYDAQTRNFSAGQLVWGEDSVSTATIISDADGGTTGTLKLGPWGSDFTDDEKLTVQYATANKGLYRTITYTGQTGNWAVGETVTGLTSSATLVVDSDTDAGATGTMLGVAMVGGPFQNGETLLGSLSGSAVAGGANTVAQANNLVVYRARSFADGSLGAWESIGTLPSAAGGAANQNLVAIRENLYLCAGGLLYWARADGLRIDTWNSVPVPAVLANLGMVNVGTYLMLIGGDVSGTDKGGVYSLQLDSDGVPRQIWYKTSDLPLILSRMAVAVKEDRVYVLGGRSTATAKATVYMARVANGAIGGDRFPA